MRQMTLAVCYTRWMCSVEGNMSTRTRKEEKRNSDNLICKKHSGTGKKEMCTKRYIGNLAGLRQQQ